MSPLIKESGYEAQQSPLCYVFATVFSLDHAQTMIGFEFCIHEQLPNKNVTVNSATLCGCKASDCARS